MVTQFYLHTVLHKLTVASLNRVLTGRSVLYASLKCTCMTVFLFNKRNSFSLLLVLNLKRLIKILKIEAVLKIEKFNLMTIYIES